MTNYLRHIAERGAGLHAGGIAPPRFAPSFELPKIVSPPMHVAALNDGAIDSTRIDEQPTASESPPRLELAPEPPARSSSPIVRADVSQESLAPPRVDPRPPAANAIQSPLTPPLSPARSRPDSIEHENRAIAEAAAHPRPVELPAAQRVDARARAEGETVEAIPSPVERPRMTVRIEPSRPADSSHMDMRSTPASSERAEVEAAEAKVMPSIDRPHMAEVEATEAKAIPSPVDRPRMAVRLEPSRAADAPHANVRSTPVSLDEDRPIEPRVGPLLVHERVAASAPRGDVRVSIGRVDVRVESNPAPQPQINRPVEPADPFASLSLARRGWRTPF